MDAAIIGAAKGILAFKGRVAAVPMVEIRPITDAAIAKFINARSGTDPFTSPITPASFTSPIPIFSFEAIAKTQKNNKNSTPPPMELKMRPSISAIVQSKSEQ